jgi:hypothetical protein
MSRLVGLADFFLDESFDTEIDFRCGNVGDEEVTSFEKSHWVELKFLSHQTQFLQTASQIFAFEELTLTRTCSTAW